MLIVTTVVSNDDTSAVIGTTVTLNGGDRLYSVTLDKVTEDVLVHCAGKTGRTRVPRDADIDFDNEDDLQIMAVRCVLDFPGLES